MKLNMNLHYHYTLKNWKYPDVYIVNRQKAKTSVSVSNRSSLFSNSVKRGFTAVISTEE